MGIFSTIDPSAVFCFACCVIPLFKEQSTTNADRIDFLTDPFFYCPVLLVAVMALIARTGKCKDLTENDKILSRWYLWNGAVIHIMMDGCVGSLDKLPLFAQQYKILDNRFVIRDVVPISIGLVELFIMAPLAIILYLGYKWNSSFTYPLEIVVCVMHIFGAVLFVLPEFLTGCKNIPVDYNFEFTLHHIVYFWFGFMANFIWIVIPLYNLKNAFQKCCNVSKVKTN